jgi:hypothetical protein
VLPVNTAPAEESHLPFYNAYIHMDGLTTTGRQGGDPNLPPSSLFGADGPEDLDLFHKHYMAYIGHGGNPGRHAENYGTNGGMLFQDPQHSLTTVRARTSSYLDLIIIQRNFLIGLRACAGVIHLVCGGLPQRPDGSRAGAVLRAPRLPSRGESPARVSSTKIVQGWPQLRDLAQHFD